MFHKRHPAAGARPGTLVLPEGAVPPKIHVIRYDHDQVEEIEVDDSAKLRALVVDGKITWIDVQGVGDEAVLRRIAEDFGIHLLALEDVVNAPQRPKIEEYADHLLMITRECQLSTKLELEVDQVGIFLGERYVLTFQEQYGDGLDCVRSRIRAGKGRIRHVGADYLAYAILDAIIDEYYPVVEGIGDDLERLEPRIMTRPTPATLARLNRHKALLLKVRRGIWPQRDALNRLLRDGSRFVTDEVRLHLRDTLDHASQVVDVVDSNRELVNGLMNIYLSVIANRTNDVMKVLTIMASIFIPLTFIAGIYGMNFDVMPELRWSWGYPVVIGVMGVTVVALLIFFFLKGWIGSGSVDGRDEEE
jgi:magnesium transporter